MKFLILAASLSIILILSCGSPSGARDDGIVGGFSFLISDQTGTPLVDVGVHYAMIFNQQLWKPGRSDSGVVPYAYNLTQNYPNPFNPQTTIGMALPQSSQVTLRIYDFTGQNLIRTLIDQSLAAGLYSVVWNGMNEDQRHVSNGFYAYEMTTGAFQKTRKMCLNMQDPGQISNLNCIPFALSAGNGRVDIPFDTLPLNEQIIWTDENGSELGAFAVPSEFNFFFIRDGYQNQTKQINVRNAEEKLYSIVMQK